MTGKPKTNDEFIAEVFALVGTDYKVIGEYVTTHTKIKMLHTVCGNEFYIEPNSFLHGRRCPYCCPSPRRVAAGTNSMWDTNQNLAKLLANSEDGFKYTQYSNVRVDWKCPKCGEIIKNKKISDVNNDGLSCHRCSDGISYPNRLMYSVLSMLNINFETEKYFKWCNYIINNKKMTGRYDFYFKYSNQEYIVEMDGHFHFNNNLMNGQTKEDSQEIDIIKDNLARKHGIHPIRIDCQEPNLEYIKDKISKSDLTKIFYLSQIDWQECECQSITSLKIQACDLWEKYHSTKIISEIMKYSQATIINWLKFCAKTGMSDFAPAFKRKITCKNTEELFESMTDASKKYGVNVSSISLCCKGKLKHAGKLADGTKLGWEYVE